MIRASISGLVNGELSVRGSNVGTRADLAEAVAFAASGLVRARIETVPLAAANDTLTRMRDGMLIGRAVLQIA